MRNRFRSRDAVVVAGLATIAAVGGFGASAKADCVHAVVYVSRSHSDPVYVYGEHDPCVSQTPWYHAVSLPGYTTLQNLPPGTPNGYFVDIRLPAP